MTNAHELQSKVYVIRNMAAGIQTANWDHRQYLSSGGAICHECQMVRASQN